MKKQLFLTAVLALMLQVTSFGQSIKLNNEGDPGSAMLEVNSASKGILIPNVSLTGITDAITIASPAVSLLVYNTATVSDVEPGYYYNAGTIVSPFWTRLSTSTGTGTAGDGSETKVTAGTNVTVTGSGTTGSPYIVGAVSGDGDVTNEIQDLSIIGNTLTVTKNGSATEIDLSPYLDNTDTQLTEGEVDAFTANNGYLETEIDGDVTNELQDLAEVLTKSNDAGNLAITNLANPIAAQDAATKAYVDLLKAQVSVVSNILLDAGYNGILSDINGNVYKTKKIGNQVWMAENLKTTRYNDGTIIPLITDNTLWEIASTDGDPAYCWYNNVPANLITYGALYNWYAIDTLSNGNKNVCPTGWHVPTNGEWTTLTTYLGGEAVAGGKMKEAGLAHWASPNGGATNESGFAGLPGGGRYGNGTFSSVGVYGLWWSSAAAEYDATGAWIRVLGNGGGGVMRQEDFKGNGFSVRCLRD
jgi:uncharacterized protein (TIGR02145 family)